VVWADDAEVAAWWLESWFRQVIKREAKSADKQGTPTVAGGRDC
jgi:hypothetical protein